MALPDLTWIESDNGVASGLKDIAQDALTCIEKVAESAEADLQGPRGGNPSSLAYVNTVTWADQVRNLRAISENECAALHELLRQPVIARIGYVDEDGEIGTVFISRTSPRSVSGYRIASYRSPIGSIAARSVGEDLSIRIDGVEQDIEIASKARLRPTKEDGGWDSTDNEIDLGARGRFTAVPFERTAGDRQDYDVDQKAGSENRSCRRI